MNKLLTAVLGAVMVSAVAVSGVHAAGMGQVEGGDIYRVKNVTKGTDFSDPTSATCNETVQFKVRIHNPGPSTISSVKVVATLPNVEATSHTSRVTVSSPNADPMSTSDTATVNLNKAGVLQYVNGSTELLDAHNVKLQTLSDAITGAGVNIGTVGVSVEQKRFVQFKAKVNCPEVKNIQVCELATKKIVTIKETDFNAAKHSKNLDDCKEVVKYIKVCELATKKIVTIKENDFDSAKHSKNLDDCKEVVVKIQVCELATMNIITIDENDFNAKKHSKNLEDCAKPGEIVVCETATKKIVTITETDFDDSKYTLDLTKCEVTPVTPQTPTELPRTGISGGFVAIAASLLTAGAAYVVNGRRNLLG